MFRFEELMLTVWRLTALFFELAWAIMFCKTSFMVTHTVCSKNRVEQTQAPFYSVLSIILCPLHKTSENQNVKNKNT